MTVFAFKILFNYTKVYLKNWLLVYYHYPGYAYTLHIKQIRFRHSWTSSCTSCSISNDWSHLCITHLKQYFCVTCPNFSESSTLIMVFFSLVRYFELMLIPEKFIASNKIYVFYVHQAIYVVLICSRDLEIGVSFPRATKMVLVRLT